VVLALRLPFKVGKAIGEIQVREIQVRKIQAGKIQAGKASPAPWVQICAVLCLTLAAWLAVPPPAQALTCRSVRGQDVCIVDIKRSAKRFWEYRATVSVAGQVQPTAIYNCREGLRMDDDGFDALLSKVPEGELVCQLYRRYIARITPPRSNLNLPQS
jgi:hypothetical protein